MSSRLWMLICLLAVPTGVQAQDEACSDQFAHLSQAFQFLARTQMDIDRRRGSEDGAVIIASLEEVMQERTSSLKEAGVPSDEISKRVKAAVAEMSANVDFSTPEGSTASNPAAATVGHESAFLAADENTQKELVEKAIAFAQKFELGPTPALRKAIRDNANDEVKGFILGAAESKWRCHGLDQHCFQLPADLNARFKDQSLLEVAAAAKNTDVIDILVANPALFKTSKQDLSTAIATDNKALVTALVGGGHVIDKEMFMSAMDNIPMAQHLIELGYQFDYEQGAALAKTEAGVRMLIATHAHNDPKKHYLYLDAARWKAIELGDTAFYEQVHQLRTNAVPEGDILSAVRRNQLDILKLMVRLNASFKVAKDFDPPALAIEANAYDAFKFLVNMGANLNGYGRAKDLEKAFEKAGNNGTTLDPRIRELYKKNIEEEI